MAEAAIPRWAEIAEAGGIRKWADASLARQGLLGGTTSAMSDAEKKAYKGRREEERKVRKELYRLAWASYRQAQPQP